MAFSNVRRRHIQMRHRPQSLPAHGTDQNALLFQCTRKLNCQPESGLNFKEYQIGLHAIDVNLDSVNRRQSRRQLPRIRMIVLQPCDVMLQCIEGSSGNDSRLAQAPPKSFRIRLARAMSSLLPTRIEPIGQPRPFEKQIEIVSKHFPISNAEYPAATIALNNRAPSRCRFNPFVVAQSETRCMCSSE